jgi:superfamily II DNA or RNA helicase
MPNLTTMVGDCVRVRRQRWRVTSIGTYGDIHVLSLSGIGPQNYGIERRVLVPFDRIEALRMRRRIRRVGSRRWREECGRVIADAGGPDALRTARTARIDLLPHQLEPALAVIRGLTSRVLIADEVGLGKTIQAGLIASELAARGAVERALVLTPAGLRDQWVAELGDRFDLRFALFDAREMRRRRPLLPVGLNPWSTASNVVASSDFVKRPDVLPAVQSCRWDLLIVDEAHGVATAADRHAAVSRLAAQAAYVLLLSATPHNGDAKGFASLCGIGDHADPLLVFRRTREEIGVGSDRHVHRLRVRSTRNEAAMHALLARFSAAVLTERREKPRDARLALATLQKRALSSPFALERTLRRRLEAMSEDPHTLSQQLLLPLDEHTGETDAGDEAPVWTCPALRDPAEERALLTRLADAAHLAMDDESKAHALARLIDRIGEPILVFTEYRDTLLHLRERVCPDAAIVHGGLSRAERRTALDAFDRGAVRVLMATDAAGEGLNLQRSCRTVVNLELPWNPMRLEQRIGRVDRIGQTRRVHVFHLLAADTHEIEMVDRLQRRLRRAGQEIGVADPLGTGDEPSSVEFPSARIDAESEHLRLVLARHVTRHQGSRACPVKLSPDTLVGVARRRVRSRLGASPLVVMRSSLPDDTGRIVASRITGLVLRLDNRMTRSSHAELLSLIAELERRNPAEIEHEPEQWADAMSAVHRAFWATRAARLLAICRRVADHQSVAHQPGLFWRRREPAHGSGFDRIDDWSTGALEAARRSRLLLAPTRQVALVLLP